MTRTIFIAASLALAITLPTAPAQAQVNRTFVSAAGSDGNNCANVATPCRHFQTAVNTTAPGGEIVALDPANYGSLTINHQITINGQGWAYVAPPNGGNAITITAGPSDNVTIHGVVLDGIGATGDINGIVFNTGASLTVTDCVVQNFEGNSGIGLAFVPDAAAKLSVSNSYFTNNSFGAYIQTSGSGAITVAIERSAFFGNIEGLKATGALGTGSLNVAVTDSVAANNTSVGFLAASSTGHSPTNIILTRTTISGNPSGVTAGEPNTAIWLNQTTITGNGIGYATGGGGTINSYLNSAINNNGSNTGTLTTTPIQ
jgi:hypothetical protein